MIQKITQLLDQLKKTNKHIILYFPTAISFEVQQSGAVGNKETGQLFVFFCVTLHIVTRSG